MSERTVRVTYSRLGNTPIEFDARLEEGRYGREDIGLGLIEQIMKQEGQYMDSIFPPIPDLNRGSKVAPTVPSVGELMKLHGIDSISYKDGDMTVHF